MDIPQSKYLARFGRRRSMDNGRDKPLPRCLLDDRYFPGRGPRYKFQWSFFSPLPFEKPIKELVFNPMKEQFQKVKKYDHYRMNYAGWNS